jgi:nucleotide-binding universal stress UspA family protein
MEEGKKILIAVDLSKSSLDAVDYVGQMVCCHPSVEVTLLHIIRAPSPDVEPDPEERRIQIEREKTEVLKMMETAGKRLTAVGVPEERICIQIRVCSAPVRVADLILAEQQGGAYQTIVVGRRGLSRKEEFLFGSVSSFVVRNARECAVWVIE